MQSKIISTAMPLLGVVLPPTFKPSPRMLADLEAFLLAHGFRKTDRWLTPDMGFVVCEFLIMRDRRRLRRMVRRQGKDDDEEEDSGVSFPLSSDDIDDSL